MNWLDVALILFIAVFLAVGARLGSLWTGACLIGGFFGAFLVEYYTLPLSEMIGGFAGARIAASALLFAGGLAAALLPGWILSRITAVFFLHIFDSLFGLLTGLLAGFIAITMVFLWVLPHAPSVEHSAIWRKSRVVRPLHRAIETFFSDRHFQHTPTSAQITDDFMKDVSPSLEKTEKAISNTTENIVDKIKGKKKR